MSFLKSVFLCSSVRCWGIHSDDFRSRNDIFGSSLQKVLSEEVANSRAKAAMKKLKESGKKQENARIIMTNSDHPHFAAP